MQLTTGKAPMHYGWIIVWLTFITVLVTAGIRSIMGVIMVPLEEEFDWSRSTISFAFGLNLFIYGLAGPFMAAAMQRFGVRRIMLYGLVLLVAGVAASLLISQIWQFQLIWGVVLGIGSGIFQTVLSATVANQWFEARRGMVMGLLMAASAAGQMIFLPFLSYLVTTYSWRSALNVFIVLGIVLIPVIALWMRDRPSDKGLLPYGASASSVNSAAKKPEGPKKSPFASAVATLFLGFRSLPFWLLAISFLMCGATTSGLIGTHFIPASIHHGIPEVGAASLFAFMGMFNIVGTLISGWLSDRFDNRWLLFWYYSFRSVLLFMLPFALDLQSYGMLIVFALFYGLDWIATGPPTVRLASDHFGKERGTVIYGWIFAFHQLGSGMAAFMAGYLYDRFESYTYSFLAAAVFCIIATLFVFGVKKKETPIGPTPARQAV